MSVAEGSERIEIKEVSGDNTRLVGAGILYTIAQMMKSSETLDPMVNFFGLGKNFFAYNIRIVYSIIIILVTTAWALIHKYASKETDKNKRDLEGFLVSLNVMLEIMFGLFIVFGSGYLSNKQNQYAVILVLLLKIIGFITTISSFNRYGKSGKTAGATILYLMLLFASLYMVVPNNPLLLFIPLIWGWIHDLKDELPEKDPRPKRGDPAVILGTLFGIPSFIMLGLIILFFSSPYFREKILRII